MSSEAEPPTSHSSDDDSTGPDPAEFEGPPPRGDSRRSSGAGSPGAESPGAGSPEAEDHDAESAEESDHDPEPSRRVDDTDERLHPRVVFYWMASGLVSTVVLGLLAYALVSFASKRLPGDRGDQLLVVAVLVAVSFAWQLVHAPLNYRRWRFRIDDQLLQARWGVLVHEEKAIPMSRLQHVDLIRGPVERLFGLATLIVFTAGSEGATFRVPGLAVPDQSEQMRDRILAARGADVL